MPVPTWRLAVVAALGAAVPLLLAPSGFALLAVNLLVLAVAAVDGLLAVAPTRLEVARSVPGIVPLDAEAEVVWSVRNPAARTAHVQLADELPPSLGAERRRARLRVPAGARVHARTTITPSRRGLFQPRAVTLRVEGPLRLVARQRTVAVPGEFRVYPPFRSRKEAELRLGRSQILQHGLRPAQGSGGGTEFDSLREYTIDDEFRRIDWAATARAGRTIVRTYRAERNQTVLVLVDTGRTMAGRVGDDAAQTVARLDHAMDAAMMLTVVGTRLGDAVGMVAFADTVRAIVGPRHRADQLSRVTEALYPLEPVLAESDYRQAFAETLARFRRRAMLVVITELAEEPMSQTLLPALPLVLRDHLVVVAGVRDPDIDRWARAVPNETSTAYRKAAAMAAQQERARSAARLRGLGAIVVDALPSRLAPDLADTYLSAKSTGRL